jgi:cardiolipin synthase A/B
MPAWLNLTLTVGGLLFVTWFVVVLLLTPAVAYRVHKRIDADSESFLRLLHSTCQAQLYHDNRITIFRNGDRFYPAMIDAIRSATRSVDLECYIFEDGATGKLFVDVLCERLRAGVVVTVVLDAIGSSGWSGDALATLRDAGGRIEYYRSIKWYSLHRLNNRTHREILVVDGRLAFVGGAGVADRWHMRTSEPQWRDTMACVEGPITAGLQAVFAENWLECCGEILTGEEFFPPLSPAGTTTAFVVKSSPSDRATISRVVFQLLIEGATRSLHINTPYFLPDRMLRTALVNAARRGVEITIIVPGAHMDQGLVRIASRRFYGQLLEAGIKIYEFQTGMMHAKIMIVDDLWSTLGTTNFDNRSFEHNDEVNIAMRDPEIARRLFEDFAADVEQSAEITLAGWRARPYWERLLGTGGWILERQG